MAQDAAHVNLALPIARHGDDRVIAAANIEHRIGRDVVRTAEVLSQQHQAG